MLNFSKNPSELTHLQLSFLEQVHKLKFTLFLYLPQGDVSMPCTDVAVYACKDVQEKADKTTVYEVEGYQIRFVEQLSRLCENFSINQEHHVSATCTTGALN
jgi:hypothetical protein